MATEIPTKEEDDMTHHDPFKDDPAFAAEKVYLRRVAEFWRRTPAEKEAANRADPRLTFDGDRWTMQATISVSAASCPTCLGNGLMFRRNPHAPKHVDQTGLDACRSCRGSGLVRIS
jgi:hypothetical protein